MSISTFGINLEYITYVTCHESFITSPRRGLRGIVFTRSVCLSVCVSVCLSVCLCVCVCVSGQYLGILFLGY